MMRNGIGQSYISLLQLNNREEYDAGRTLDDEVVSFIKANHRNPSKYCAEERGLVNWCKHQRKIINAGEMKPERMKMFERLQ